MYLSQTKKYIYIYIIKKQDQDSRTHEEKFETGLQRQGDLLVSCREEVLKIKGSEKESNRMEILTCRSATDKAFILSRTFLTA
jgi:hypothetical protein